MIFVCDRAFSLSTAAQKLTVERTWLFAVSEVTYDRQQTPRTKFLVRGVSFTTTFHPTVISGTHGNSGDKSAEEQVLSGRNGYKVPEMPWKTFYYIFGSIDGVRTVWQRQPPKALQPCGFWAVWKTKNSGQKCVWPQIWPLTRPQFNNYRGVAQLIARRIWEHRRHFWRLSVPTAESPSTVRISGGSEKEKSSQNCVWPQIWPLTRPQFNNYRGVAQLIARRIWDAEAASLSLATPTNF